MSDKRRPCNDCGIATRSETNLCYQCRTNPAHRELTGGHWSKRAGGVRVWVWHVCDDCGERLLPGDRCDTCLTWATKNARDHLWAQMSLANRGRIRDLIDARKLTEMEAA